MSNLAEIKESIIALVAGITKTTVDINSSADALSEWDSLAQMKIIIEVEKKYDLEIEDEWIAKLNSVANVVAYLEQRLS
jgi:acyl carrier protein